jgi:hypothetical protein
MGKRRVTTSPEVSMLRVGRSSDLRARHWLSPLAPTVHASQPCIRSVLVVEVVLAYRCGAVWLCTRFPFKPTTSEFSSKGTSMEYVCDGGS